MRPRPTPTFAPGRHSIVAGFASIVALGAALCIAAHCARAAATPAAAAGAQGRGPAALAAAKGPAPKPQATPPPGAKTAKPPEAKSPATPPGDAGMKAQVRVEARVLEWQLSSGLDFDFAVGYARNPGSGSILDSAGLTLPANPAMNGADLFFGGSRSGSGSFSGVIQALETAGKVRVVSRPTIVLTSLDVPEGEVNGIAAAKLEHKKLETNLDIPYESTRAIGEKLASVTEYKDTGVSLEVALMRVDGNLVTLDMISNVSELSGFINVGLNDRGQPLSVPTVDSRMIQNRLIVPDGALLIAGLMKTTQEIDQRQGIPWISEIPVLSWFLSNRSRSSGDTELIFLVRPEIVRPDPAEIDSTAPDPVAPQAPGTASPAK